MWGHLFSDGVHVGAQLAQRNAPVGGHHAGPVQLPHPLVGVGLDPAQAQQLARLPGFEQLLQG